MPTGLRIKLHFWQRRLVNISLESGPVTVRHLSFDDAANKIMRLLFWEFVDFGM